MYQKEISFIQDNNIIGIHGGVITLRKENGKYGYICRVENINGKVKPYKSHRFSKKKNAKEALDILKSYADENKLKSDTQKNISLTENVLFSDVALSYLADYQTNKKYSSQKKAEEDIINNILPFFENQYINDQSPKTIYAFKQYLQNKETKSNKKICTASKSRIFCRLQRIFDFAVTLEYINKNPSDNIKGFGKDHSVKEMNIYTKKEFELFAESITDLKDRVTFCLLFFGGLRKGELLALQWSHVLFQDNEIFINKSCYRGVISTPKTTSSIRKISLPKPLMEMLKQLYNEQSNILGFDNTFYVIGFDKPLSANALDHKNRKYAKLSGIEKRTIHEFRHSHVCYLLNELSIPVKDVSIRIGHKDTAETLNTYSHKCKNHTDMLISKMETDW